MSADARERQLAELDGSTVDVLVIGAGINGASTFRELALNGVSVLLVESGDYCGGTSAAPSRLIHGGLKYLENGELRLVAESTLERNRLLHNAPHLVRPLPCTVPFQSWFGGLAGAVAKLLHLPGGRFRRRGAVVVELGLSIYDWLGRKRRVMPRHRLRGRARSHQMFPGLDPAVVATATYYDAWVTQPERLCLELVTDTLAERGAQFRAALSYARVTGLGDGRIRIRDETSGREIGVDARVVVNATGPWIDKVNALLGIEGRYIGGSKGSHLVLDHPKLLRALGGHMLYFETGDNRLCLVYPIGDRVLLGATDLRIEDPDGAVCDEDEVDYLLGALRELLPGVEVAREHIVYRYSGVRPLPYSDEVNIGSVSRDHSIGWDESDAGRPFPVASLVGGKWTTFRAFGEHAADQVLARLGRARTRHTHDTAIGGGRGFPGGETLSTIVSGLAEEHGLSPATVGELLRRYGRNDALLATVATDEGERSLVSLPSYRAGEIRHLCAREHVLGLEDLVFRRTTLALEGRAGSAALAELAELAAPILGWDAPRIVREIERCDSRLRAAREPVPVR